MKKLLLLLPLLFLSACGGRTIRHSAFSRISIGMNKNQVRKEIGEPQSIRCTSDKGVITEAWEYDVFTPPTLAEAFSGPTFNQGRRDFYWLYFVNNLLAQWGRPNDWPKEATHIQEFRWR